MTKNKFAILISIVSISGFSQGMLLPLIAVIFENDGLSSSMNGLNAIGLYIGILL
ncbi:MFS transporter, partial [Xanthomonas citri pv. punicae]|nr:MFS transporter [Xanthomonas citri pv. punicae]